MLMSQHGSISLGCRVSFAKRRARAGTQRSEVGIFRSFLEGFSRLTPTVSLKLCISLYRAASLLSSPSALSLPPGLGSKSSATTKSK